MYYKNWEVQLQCDGVPMDEYDARIDDDWTVSCWVPSEAGKTFSVHWRNESDQLSSADTYIDGQRAGRSTAVPFRWGRRLGVRTSSSTLSAFTFAPLEVTDDDALAEPDGAPTALGQVEVRILRVSSQHRVWPRPMSDLARAHDRRPGMERRFTGEQVLVHERSKKAGTHCVGLGHDWNSPLGGNGARDGEWRYRYVDRPDEPYVKFVFRYRPRALLQADGLIPRTPRSVLQSVSHANSRDAPTTPIKESPSVQRIAGRRAWNDESMKEEVPPTPDVRKSLRFAPAGQIMATPSTPGRSALGMSSVSAIEVDVEVVDLTAE